MVGESNHNLFLIQVEASIFTEFQISEFEISRFDCIALVMSGRADFCRRVIFWLASFQSAVFLYPSLDCFHILLPTTAEFAVDHEILTLTLTNDLFLLNP